jgi:alanine racemase
VDALTQAGIRPPIAHASGSGGIANYPEADFDLIRPGLLLVGICPTKAPRRALDLRPTLAVRTRIITVRDVSAGQAVGYGMTYVTSRPTRLAVISIGLASGYPRRLSNRGYVLVRGHRAPIVGIIGLSHCMIDVTDIPIAIPGDIVTAIGQDANDQITISEVAGWAETITDEICMMAARMPRLIMRTPNEKTG